MKYDSLYAIGFKLVYLVWCAGELGNVCARWHMRNIGNLNHLIGHMVHVSPQHYIVLLQINIFHI